MVPRRPHFGPIWDAIVIPNCKFGWKKGSKKLLTKRVTPLTQTTDYDHGPGLPDSPPRVRGFLNKKQLSEQETTTAAHFWVKFWALFWNVGNFRIHLWFFGESWNRKRQVVAELVLLCYCLFPKPVIWHALGQGPANSLDNAYIEGSHVCLLKHR